MSAANQQTNDCVIDSVKFVRGITGTDEILEDDRPHIVAAGRSNVGKSSVLNTVVNQEIARVSKTPGKTTEINLYLIDEKAFLVDLPGYGYAKMSATQAEKMRKQMIWYLARSGAPLALLVLVIDIRRGIQAIDRDLLDIASGERIPVVIVANKIDKCNQSELVAAERKLANDLKSHPDITVDVIKFSAHDGTGRVELCAIIKSVYAD